MVVYITLKMWSHHLIILGCVLEVIVGIVLRPAVGPSHEELALLASICIPMEAHVTHLGALKFDGVI